MDLKALLRRVGSFGMTRSADGFEELCKSYPMLHFIVVNIDEYLKGVDSKSNGELLQQVG
jgi:hypothetical protein